jgi:hypothetical protein
MNKMAESRSAYWSPVLIAFFLAMLSVILYVSLWENEGNTRVATGAALVTTTTVPAPQSYCKGFYGGQAAAIGRLGKQLREYGLSDKEAAAALAGVETDTCNTALMTRTDFMEAQCEGLAHGYIGVMQEFMGPPPNDYMDSFITECVKLRSESREQSKA